MRCGDEGGAWLGSENDKYGFIDMAGNEVAPCIFENASDFSEGLAAVSVGEKWGYISIVK